MKGEDTVLRMTEIKSQFRDLINIEFKNINYIKKQKCMYERVAFVNS